MEFTMKITKTLKKIISLSLIAVMLCVSLIGMTSCKSDNLYAAYGKQLESVKAPESADKTLTVVMSPDFAPMEFVYVNGTKQEIVGFDVLLANYLAKELGMKVEIKPMSFDACQAAVQAGNADIGLSGFSWMPDRAENFEITDYYIAGTNETEQIIITKKENEGKLTKVEDFKGLKIGYQGASLQEYLVEATFKDVAELVPYVDIGTATEALKTGTIDALAVAGGNGDSIIANASGAIAKTGYEFELEEKLKNNVGIIQKGNKELLEKVNAALDKAMKNNYYSDWYEACQILAKSKTIDELGYDENGNKIK